MSIKAAALQKRNAHGTEIVAADDAAAGGRILAGCGDRPVEETELIGRIAAAESHIADRGGGFDTGQLSQTLYGLRVESPGPPKRTVHARDGRSQPQGEHLFRLIPERHVGKRPEAPQDQTRSDYEYRGKAHLGGNEETGCADPPE